MYYSFIEILLFLRLLFNVVDKFDANKVYYKSSLFAIRFLVFS